MQIINDIDRIKQYMTQPPEMANIKPASTWVDTVVENVCNPDQELSGVPIQYAKHYENLRFRKGEVSIWSGYNGHGKSLILNQYALFACEWDRFVIISPEMPVHKTMQRMTHQATARRHPVEAEVRGFHKWTDGRIWLYDQLGTVKTKMVYAVIRYAVYELGINQIVIDSLMKCGIGTDDYNAQKTFVDELTTIAKDLSIHIHLVAHSRKALNEKAIPDKHDIRGAGEITDMVDNVLIQFRNKNKEAKIATAKRDRDMGAIRELDKKYDALLVCCKQRHGDWEGNIGLWFDLPSQLYLNGEDHEPVRRSYI